MWLTLLLNNWRELLIASLISGLVLMTSMWQTATAQRDARIAEIEAMQTVATQYKNQSEHNARVINDAIPIMVEQAQKTAVANYKKRFGNAACGIRTNGLPAVSYCAGETDSPRRTDDPTSEFVVACATDAGRLKLWQDWAILNQLPVE